MVEGQAATAISEKARRLHGKAMAAFLLLVLLASYWLGPGPSHDLLMLQRVGPEALQLAQSYPAARRSQWGDVPRADWPPLIAGLAPERVIIRSWGVEIMIKPYMDGGWGYHVARDGRRLPMPATCYQKTGPDLYWHAPC